MPDNRMLRKSKREEEEQSVIDMEIKKHFANEVLKVWILHFTKHQKSVVSHLCSHS